jgi:hypothetical protein
VLGKFGGQEHHVDLAHETKVTRRLLSDNLERKDRTEIKATLICVDVGWVILDYGKGWIFSIYHG